jgi:endogenous inhibitor of DNA gyrase (YacG/DUF329 family)
MSDPFKGPPAKGVIACTICGKPPSPKFAPFCSRRCADLDLGRWLKGAYIIPAPPDEAEAPEAPPPLDDE